MRRKKLKLRNLDEFIPDSVLLRKPDTLDLAISKQKMFVSTVSVQITPMPGRSDKELSQILCPKIKHPIVRVDSNYGHAGDEKFNKPDKKKPKKVSKRKRPGDGTNFDNSIGYVIEFENNYFKIKHFPTTGEVQIPGLKTIDQVISVGAVSQLLVDFISCGTNTNIIVDKTKIILINYKFHVHLGLSKRLKLDLSNLCSLLVKSSDNMQYTMFNVHPPTEKPELSFKFDAAENGTPLVSIWPSGKILVRGSKSSECAIAIYDYISKFIFDNWEGLIYLIPPKDGYCSPAPIIELSNIRIPNNVFSMLMFGV